MNENYTARVAKNSTWASLGFLVTSVSYFLINVQITRYFGKDNYGIYSYFAWLTGILALVGTFGLNQAVMKFLPRYWFEENRKNQARTLFKKLLLAQLAMSILVAVIFGIFRDGLKPFMNLDGDAGMFLFIAALAVVPLTLNTFFASTLSTTQEFRKLTIIQSATIVAYLCAVTVLVVAQRPLSDFYWLFLVFNTVLCLGFLWGNAGLLKKPAAKTMSETKTVLTKEIVSYSGWSYLNTFFGQIAWERSEIFFLAMFSDSGQIAVYSLAYGLAILLTSVFAPINTVLSYTTAEIIGSEKTDKLKFISKHATKYLAIILVPAVIFATFIMKEAVSFIYGNNFTETALLFPLLAFSQIAAMIISPASNVPVFRNEAHKITAIAGLTAAVNIGLDLLLIPKYEALGAAAANTGAQIFSIMLIMINAKKYRLEIFNRNFVKVLLANFGLAVCTYAAALWTPSLLVKILEMMVLGGLYGWLVIKTAFNSNDLGVLQNLVHALPKSLRTVGNFFYRVIEKNTR